jgi:hypothetical protein
MDARFLAVAGLKGGTAGGPSFPQPTNIIAAPITTLRMVTSPLLRIRRRRCLGGRTGSLNSRHDGRRVLTG